MRKSEERKPSTNGVSSHGELRGQEYEIKRHFRSVKDNLDYVARASRQEMPDQDQRLKAIKQSLLVFGRHIASVLKRDPDVQPLKLW